MDGENVESKPVQPKRGLVDFFAENPRIGLIGTAASVVGLLLSPIFFFLGQKDRDVRCVTSASPTTIVKNGQSSNLRVFYEGKELTSDVTSVQIALWNAGRESVKRENILSKTIALKFDPPSNIFEARVKNVTRSIVNFQLDASERANGILKCSWDVLEPGDGALLEVFYAGSAAKVIRDGVIEGQGAIREGARPGQTLIYLSYMGRAAILFIALVIGLIVAIQRYRRIKIIAEAIFTALGIGLIVGFGLLMLIMIGQALESHAVPFSF
jgi:hypothetical protein